MSACVTPSQIRIFESSFVTSLALLYCLCGLYPLLYCPYGLGLLSGGCRVCALGVLLSGWGAEWLEC